VSDGFQAVRTILRCSKEGGRASLARQPMAALIDGLDG
jgi:hypothetical protein